MKLEIYCCRFYSFHSIFLLCFSTILFSLPVSRFATVAFGPARLPHLSFTSTRTGRNHQQKSAKKLYSFVSGSGIRFTSSYSNAYNCVASNKKELKMSSSDNINHKIKLSFVDIGANLLDERYTEGIYHGKKRHEPDFQQVLNRACESGVTHVVLTAGTLKESRRALELVRSLRREQQSNNNNDARKNNIHFGCTIGIHPTRCSQEFVDNKDTNAEQVLIELKQLAIDGQSDHSVVAIGEIGLDYDRLEFCPKNVQHEYLNKQLDTFFKSNSTDTTSASINNLDHLPLFLHNRNCSSDLLRVLQQRNGSRTNEGKKGVVHSFDDSLELAQQFIKLGYYIGLNGCSLRTKENLEVVKQLPLEKILLETDCPYCEIKQSHAGFEFVKTKFEKKAEKKFELGKMVKGRNEPCQMIQVAEVIAGVKGIPVEQVAHASYHNSLILYGWNC